MSLCQLIIVTLIGFRIIQERGYTFVLCISVRSFPEKIHRGGKTHSIWMMPSCMLGAQNKKRKTAEWQHSLPSFLIHCELKGTSLPHTHAIMILSAQEHGPNDHGLTCLNTRTKLSPSCLQLFIAGVFITPRRLTNTVIRTQWDESARIINTTVPLLII